jgi:multiple sugar transport system ATP-binding protein
VGAVTFEGVGKVYADGTRAVSGMNLEIRDGEFMVLVGPSGCGKTTALRMVAGLESISEGVLRIGERVVNNLPARDRDIAMVFQSYALYPHLTVYDNIAFSLRLRKMSKDELDGRVREAAHVLGLTEFLERKPRALSGGQRQRVAMGRAIVRQPQAYLMDEPLSNLDAKLRVHMRAEIASLQNDLGVTTIYVTHDQVEAMTMGDRVAVMRKGELQQVAPPQTLYERPVNLFVGGFIGSPAMNLVEASVERHNGRLAVHLGEHSLALSDELLAYRSRLESYVGKRVVVGIRPENLEDAALEPDTPDEQKLRGVVVLREPLGSEIVAHFTVDAPPALTEDVRELARDVGQESAVQAAAAEGENETVMVGRFGPRSRIANGQTIDVAVETGALHFFDVDTGLGIYSQTDSSNNGEGARG